MQKDLFCKYLLLLFGFPSAVFVRVNVSDFSITYRGNKSTSPFSK